MGTFCLLKKNGLKKNTILNFRFEKLGNIRTYILIKNIFADSRKKFPQLYGENTRIALKKIKTEILLGKTEPAILFAPTV
jgi:hypothetical protein